MNKEQINNKNNHYNIKSHANKDMNKTKIEYNKKKSGQKTSRIYVYAHFIFFHNPIKNIKYISLL
ncbi:hypothetical protein PFAG_05780 [Plasmodium falciparum Santa Lucia]|uniref:Uncharacterized protein n=4 Tax=Plasmodium falciparum TaxID=5833 RepID=A0A024VY49_PLAFA|nr:hypothetical protein PFTANZ_05933 [Plasmodium falciparum Tanzania (2000708)]ETW39554.1 hypothetical protein PFNF135_05584 [Plasmodium falciparum NF135/5.C10]EUR62041.1 hypothetical protein PFBG_05757 [Plasmodium falciparum 7G8]EUT79209.1 hypothetical protein PFAG_05780 [Plasmodium falciparum Santa Lucia]